MKIILLTPDVRYLASRYDLLLGFQNAARGILFGAEGTPEERLTRIAELVAFVRERTRFYPMLCRAERADAPEQQAAMLQPWQNDVMYQKVNLKGEPLGEPYAVPLVLAYDGEDERYTDDAGNEIMPEQRSIMEHETWDDPERYPYTEAQARQEAQAFMRDMIAHGRYLRLDNDVLRELFAAALIESSQPAE